MSNKIKQHRRVRIYTDGGCSGNPGPGGYAAIIRTSKMELTVSGSKRKTTNNRMELMAVIVALENLRRSRRVTIYSDSEYVVKGASKWLPRWKANGWRSSRRSAVKNKDLWERLDDASAVHNVNWRWIRAHNGHPENERVDQMAKAEIDKLRNSGDRGDRVE